MSPTNSNNATNAKHEFLVLLPDVPDALEKRMSVRPQHLAAVGPRVQAGEVVLGGATLDEPLAPGGDGPPKINGSVIIYAAESEADVRRWIEEDVYHRTGVWDAAKIKIIPFKSAVRVQL